ncbi:uncharacterized protein BO72DRAFT_450503 [Aspergillus fijiensis CBS 313.89]|uniref:Hydrophobin n=1 Tax=Aspergillus fijiensis CBS 313.89 TaxID=1448319 RepID=A0A8G1RM16_9EURO|nr:uncharacterized protein BO72DRAFT_450503 [Aspergillus fijiensis CBS 313.89]RAK74618.1 hypothetical protein BO72DRAFT_450503 [Aspergillus fijiensis CBS 313.89]
MRPILLVPLFSLNYTRLMVAAQSCPGTLRCCRNVYAADNLSSPIPGLLDTYGNGAPVGAGVGTLCVDYPSNETCEQSFDRCLQSACCAANQSQALQERGISLDCALAQ